VPNQDRGRSHRRADVSQGQEGRQLDVALRMYGGARRGAGRTRPLEASARSAPHGRGFASCWAGDSEGPRKAPRLRAAASARVHVAGARSPWLGGHHRCARRLRGSWPSAHPDRALGGRALRRQGALHDRRGPRARRARSLRTRGPRSFDRHAARAALSRNRGARGASHPPRRPAPRKAPRRSSLDRSGDGSERRSLRRSPGQWSGWSRPPRRQPIRSSQTRGVAVAAMAMPSTARPMRADRAAPSVEGTAPTSTDRPQPGIGGATPCLRALHST
jgi:hypothetical protein